MDIVKQFASGYFAVYHGKRYRADGGRQGHVTLRDEQTGQTVGTAPITELDEWYSAKDIGTYLGEPFQVKAELAGGQYWISYEGSNGRKIAAEWRNRQKAEPNADFWQEDMYTFMAHVPKEQVRDIHEVRRDALSAWRAARGGE